MSKNRLDQSDYMNIILSYNGKEKHINVGKHKQLSYIQNKIYKLFYPINSDICIKYKNIDYSSFLDEQIGFIFLKKSTIKLVITEKKESSKTPINHYKESNKNNVSSEVSNTETMVVNNRYETSDSNGNTPNYKKYQKLKLPPISLSSNLNTNKKNNSKNNNYKTPSKLKSNKNRNISSITHKNQEKQSNFYDVNNIIKNIYKLKDINSFRNCGECVNEKSVYYCRSCNKFICEDCKTKKHNGNYRIINIEKNKTKTIEHLLIEINYDKISENIENYKNLLKTKLMVPYGYLEFSTDESNVIQEKKWRIKFDMKIDELVNKANDIKEEKNDGLICDINSEDINSIKKYISGYKCNGQDNPYRLFKDLCVQDKNIQNMANTDKKNSSMVKINNMFEEIENEIDKVLFDLEEKI